MITEVKKGARLIPGFQSTKLTEVTYSILPGSEVAQLIEAAKQEALSANGFAEQAKKMAAAISDAGKRAQMEQAIAKVVTYSKQVTDLTDLLSKNPNNKTTQEELATAQKSKTGTISSTLLISQN